MTTKICNFKKSINTKKTGLFNNSWTYLSPSDYIPIQQQSDEEYLKDYLGKLALSDLDEA